MSCDLWKKLLLYKETEIQSTLLDGSSWVNKMGVLSHYRSNTNSYTLNFHITFNL